MDLHHQLFHACDQKGNKSKILHLIAQGARAHVQDSSGWSTFQVAISRKYDLQVLDELVSAGAVVSHVDHKGASALQVAVLNQNDVVIIQFLIRLNADVNHRSLDGWSVLHHAVYSRNGLPVIKCLVEHGADILYVGTDGWGVLHTTVANGNDVPVVQYLVEKKADVNGKIKDQVGNSVLHVALMSRVDSAVILYLLSQGATVNSVNQLGWTTLHAAIFGKQPASVVQQLHGIGGRNLLLAKTTRTSTLGGVTYPAGSTAVDFAKLANSSSEITQLLNPGNQEEVQTDQNNITTLMQMFSISEGKATQVFQSSGRVLTTAIEKLLQAPGMGDSSEVPTSAWVTPAPNRPVIKPNTVVQPQPPVRPTFRPSVANQYNDDFTLGEGARPLIYILNDVPFQSTWRQVVERLLGYTYSKHDPTTHLWHDVSVDQTQLEILLQEGDVAYTCIYNLFRDRLPSPKATLDGLTTVQLYSGEEMYTIVNNSLRQTSRSKEKLAPLLPFLKLMLATLRALPPAYRYQGMVYRGEPSVHPKFQEKYRVGNQIIFYGFTSCTVDPSLLSQPRFAGTTGPRTMYYIDLVGGHFGGAYRIHEFSFYGNESEVLLEPGVCFEVTEAICIDDDAMTHIGVNVNVGARIVKLKQVEPKFKLLAQ